MARLLAHDCYGAILVIEGVRIKFICELCHKPYQVLDVRGLHSISPHSSDKHENVTPRPALRYALDKMDEIERESSPARTS